VISAHRFDAIVDYEPDDFTIGVGAGIPLARLAAVLAEHGQEIPVDLGHGALGTAGGLVARAPWGPRSAHYGRLGTLLLGVEAMRGGGAEFASGGMVVKNVAGYQLGKFLCGAHGAGGFLLRVNLKLRSKPDVRSLRLARYSSARGAFELAAALRRARLEPAMLCVLSGSAVEEIVALGLPGRSADWVVVWMFEGIVPRVAWLADESERIARDLGGTLSRPHKSDAATTMLDWLTAFGDPPEPRDDLGVARIVVRPTELAAVEERLRADLQKREGIATGFVADAAGVLTIRWTAAPSRVADPLADVLAAAIAHRGWAALLFLPPAHRGAVRRVLTPDPNAELERKVLAAFGAPA
jgi:FAD/FMN-containing dehydrogenase